MGVSLFALLFAATVGAAIPETTVDEQQTTYRRLWDSDLVWQLKELPTSGSVADYRVPYSGHIYPDASGGTMRTLRKYDAAFHTGRLLATDHERWDTTAYQEEAMVPQRVGLFGIRTRPKPTMRTPPWHGHCNGWTAAAIRHAEPQHSVVRNGVTFSPADIKALLADLYMYSHYESLAGEEGLVDAGMLHVTLANWLGRQSHPLGMESHPGREKWNFPVYGYTSSVTNLGPNAAEVETKIQYAYYSRGEYQQSPRLERQKYFHYRLDLDGQGKIVGGRFHQDSSMIDLLWVPLAPVRGGAAGNERGNPHLDADTVLSIWRGSVSDDVIKKWRNIDDAAAAPASGE